MKKKKNVKYIIYIIFVMLVITPLVVSAVPPGEMDPTTLFIEIDKHWKYNESGDRFVVRTDVENVGEHIAYEVTIKLENIPEDWIVTPSEYIVDELAPGEISVDYFIIERGDEDETIYASAEALNAPRVISETIPIPIFLPVLALLGVLCGFIVYKDKKK